jgi:hypothetical protein
MLSKNLIYKNGHFYDSLNHKRIGIRDGAEVCIVALTDDFVEAPLAGKIITEFKSSKELENELGFDGEITSYHKVFDKGKFLYFSIKKKFDDISINHEFQVELLEDLYFFYKRVWKKNEENLYDCACVVRKNISDTIPFFEEIYGKSLNQLFKNTFVHYFNNEGNPACNAIDRFYEKAGDEDSNLSRYRKVIL